MTNQIPKPQPFICGPKVPPHKKTGSLCICSKNCDDAEATSCGITTHFVGIPMWIVNLKCPFYHSNSNTLENVFN